MSKENYKNVSMLRFLGDWLIIILSLCLAYVVRFHVFQGDEGHVGLVYYLAIGLFASPIFLLIFGLFGMYDQGTFENQQRIVERLVPANIIGTLLLFAGLYLIKNIDISRLTIGIFFVISTLLIMVGRIALRHVLRGMMSRGLGQKNVLLIGSSEAALDYYETMHREPQWGIRISACLSDTPRDGLPCDGAIDELNTVLLGGGFDEVVAVLGAEESEMFADIIYSCEKNGTKLSILPFYHKHIHSRMQIEEYGDFYLLNIRRIPLDNIANAFIKRVIDITVSLLMLVALSPIMLLAAIGTGLTCRGSVIFRQKRVGRNNKQFAMYKFRSMQEDGGSNGWTKKDDPRRSFFGSVLRKFSIDELPQLFNVLRGDMSLIGPRPELPHFVEQFRECVPMYMVKHQVRPGMSGWAQINGLRGDTSIPDRIRYDLWYIENWSLLLDLRIILMTPIRGLVSPEKIVRPPFFKKK